MGAFVFRGWAGGVPCNISEFSSIEELRVLVSEVAKEHEGLLQQLSQNWTEHEKSFRVGYAFDITQAGCTTILTCLCLPPLCEVRVMVDGVLIVPKGSIASDEIVAFLYREWEECRANGLFSIAELELFLQRLFAKGDLSQMLLLLKQWDAERFDS